MTGQLRRRATAARRRLADGVEAGAAAVYAVILIPVLLVFAAFAVDVAAWYVEIQRVQKTVDAASLAAAPFMPQTIDPGNPTDPASLAALDLIARNGYDLSAATASATVEEGERTSQVRVTLSSTINNGLAGLAGIPTTTITRTAVADFTAPAPMGSPCNTLGNEPPGNAFAGPVSAKPPTPFETCPDGTEQANFWSQVLGPESGKRQGDRFMTRRCGSGDDGCSPTTNSEFRARGYYSILRVAPTAVGSPVTVQVYDPAWINNGRTCDGLPNSGITNGMNPYAPDAEARYARGLTAWCPGDQDANQGSDGNGGPGRIDTSFAVLEPNETLDPTASQPVSTACIKQFRGYGAGQLPTAAALTEGDPAYNENVAQVLHQWVTLCTFTPTEPGDHYIQFRTNVPLAGTPSTNTNGLPPGIFTGNTSVVSQDGDNSAADGRGNNSFTFRAFIGSPGAENLARGQELSVSGYERFPIYQNAPGGAVNTAPVFNLIRVLPGAAGQNIRFSFFDVAEGSSVGSFVEILPPVDVTGDTLEGEPTAVDCTASGVQNGDFPDCRVPISSANNGKLQELRVPVPEDYGCDFESAGGCWFRVRVSFGGGASVNDTTTWTATIDGDPVRLVE